MPQVIAAGISTNATPPSNGSDSRIEIMGSSEAEQQTVRVNFINQDYFPVLRIPLSQGRLWDGAETRRGAQLAVINQTMARQYWPKGDAIGHQFRIPGLKSQSPYQPAAAGSEGWLEIVGVVADARNDGLRNPIKPAVFVPYTLQMRMFTQILVRTRVPPLSILREVRTQLVQIDRDQQVMRVRDLESWITGLTEYSQQRVVATLFGVFSVLAMLLAGAGLYSVVSYGVATRTNEFGIRMALGGQGEGCRADRAGCHGSERGGRAGGGTGAESDLRQAGGEVGDGEFAGSPDSGGCDGVAAAGGGIGLPGAGAPGGVCGSDGSTAVRIAASGSSLARLVTALRCGCQTRRRRVGAPLSSLKR